MAFDLDWVSLETLEALATNYGYGAVFSGILLENLGLPLPGEAIVLVGGFMAGRGDLSLEGTIISASSGAIVGNTIGYWLGFYGGWPLLLSVSRLLRLSEEKLNEIKERFSNNAGQAVFFGRFITLTAFLQVLWQASCKCPLPNLCSTTSSERCCGQPPWSALPSLLANLSPLSSY